MSAMFFSFCGAPSGRSVLISRLVSAALEEALDGVNVIYANSSRDLIKALKQRDKRPCLLYCDFPDIHVSRLVVERGIPTVLTAEPFEDIVCYCMAAGKMNLHAGIRHAARSVAALYPIAASGTAAMLHLTGQNDQIAHLMHVIALSLDLELTDESVRRIEERFRKGKVGAEDGVEALARAHIAPARGAEAQWAALTPEDRALLAQMADGYQPLIEGKPAERMVWPASFFLNGDSPHHPANGTMPMTGPARILFFGPYLTVPAGRWSVEVRFAVKDNWSSNSITIDIASGAEVLAIGSTPLPRNGFYSARLDFTVSDADKPLEVRGIIMSGAIEGDFQVLDIVVTPAGPEGNRAAGQ